MSPSLTSYITISSLTKLWFLGVATYLIRKTSAKFHFTPQGELFLYLCTAIIAFLISRGEGERQLEMTREESELVKDYLRHRKEGESLGIYLDRVEREEEKSRREGNGNGNGNVGVGREEKERKNNGRPVSRRKGTKQ